MKKLTLKYTLLAGLLSVTQYSCNKALDLKPLDQISDVTYWKTANDFMLAANQFYTYERSFVDANNISGTDVHNDERSDLSAKQNQYSNGSNATTVTDGNYTQDYTRIRNINYLLARAEAYSNPAEIAKYVAEAKFFRAYVYFELLQSFGGVPLISTLLDPNSDQLKGARNTRDEVADFIIADLNAAIAVLPLQSSISGADAGRVSKGAAQSFLARVALYEGTWQKFRSNAARANTLLDMAVSASDAVISSGEYSLFMPAALGDSALKYMFTLENTDGQGMSNPAGLGKASNHEYILSNRYDFGLRQAGTNFSFGRNHYDVTKKFANMFLSKDGLPIEKSSLFIGYATTSSEFQNRDNRMWYTMMVPGRPYWSQAPKNRITWTGDAADLANANYPSFVPNAGSGYHTQKWVTERNVLPTQEAYDYPVIRYAEVLLIYAEAIFERNGQISDADLDKSLNLLRMRINQDNGMPKLSNSLVAASGLDMRTEIRRERTIEFYQEGFRIDDLKRWKTAETEMPKPLLGITWTGTQYQTSWPEAGSLPKDANGNIIIESSRTWTEKNYLLPIPTQEIQLNAGITQNPGW